MNTFPYGPFFEMSYLYRLHVAKFLTITLVNCVVQRRHLYLFGRLGEVKVQAAAECGG